MCLHAQGGGSGRLGLHVSRRLAEGTPQLLRATSCVPHCVPQAPCVPHPDTCADATASHAAALGGSLSVRSRDGSGTRFTAIISVAWTSSDEHGDSASNPSSPTASAGSRRSSLDGRGSVDGRDAAAQPEDDDVGPDDTGMLPYLPPDALHGDGFEALKQQRGKLREMTDLVRCKRGAA